ncbi:MAG: DegT/DnrJ/EryC1/StrS family aminotransferase [Chloroflexi bacterium]|nr:DegT/DnrJ/EryC1/StrS family aminotransferase [Chloroflexota bacterium]
MPFVRPLLGNEEAEAVAQVVRSGWLSQGERVAEFEQKFAQYAGASEAVAVASGTAALHMAMIVAGVGPGDEVIVPSFTFAATANAVLFQGAIPVFADIDASTFNISVEDVSRRITPRTRAIVPVHYAGQMADVAGIVGIARKHGLVVIEDAAEAHGATYNDRHAGLFGDMAIFSFTPIKSMTTGEGGIIITDNREYVDRLKILRNHGMDAPYHHIALGYNYRMTEMQAALGLVQLGRLDGVLHRKKEIAEYYNSRLNSEGILLPAIAPTTTRHAYMLYTVRVPATRRDAVVAKLTEKGVEAKSTYFPPVHLQPYYRQRFGFKEGTLPITEEVAKQVISLPVSATLSDDEVEYVARSFVEILQRQ